MSARVLSTSEAQEAIAAMQRIIAGGFTEEINNLNREGTILSDESVWDGPLAAQFRGDIWPQTKGALDKAAQELEELRGQLDKIRENIFTAGGA